MTATLL
jgi:hypothetical protein